MLCLPEAQPSLKQSPCLLLGCAHFLFRGAPEVIIHILEIKRSGGRLGPTSVSPQNVPIPQLLLRWAGGQAALKALADLWNHIFYPQRPSFTHPAARLLFLGGEKATLFQLSYTWSESKTSFKFHCTKILPCLNNGSGFSNISTCPFSVWLRVSPLAWLVRH